MVSTNPMNAVNPSLNAIVKASAGVGKTYLLVTRLIRLLLDDVAPDSILAITFTRKAAAEMQTRLYERLYEFAISDKSTVSELLSAIGLHADDKLIKKAQSLYEFILQSPKQVRTTTFHAFCQDILQKFPLEADVPPGFDLLDDSETYQQIAWDLLYDEATHNPDSKIAQALEALLDLTGSLDSTQNSLTKFLEQRADWWAYSFTESDPAFYALSLLSRSLDYKPDENIYSELFNDRQKQNIYRIIELWHQHLTSKTEGFISDLQKALESNTFKSGNSEYSVSESIFLDLYSVFYNSSGNIRETKFNKTRAKKIGDDAEQEFLELFSYTANKLEKIKQKRNIEFNIQLNAAWYVAGNRLIAIYQQIKQEQRLLDFTDLEWKTFVLLNHSDNALWVQYKLDQRIRHLLIDEFQDTNPTQWRLLLPIMEEFQYNTEEPRSVFIVGDEKQSIYSFRRADPQLLNQASEWVQDNLGGSEYPMDKSRRSAPQIMNLVNSIFSSDVYRSTLKSFSTHSTHLNNTPGWLRLLPLVTEEAQDEEILFFRNPLIEPRKEKPDVYFQEGMLIADTINQMIRENHGISENGETRPINFGDIMLLIRSRKHVKQYEKALREANIPYISNNKGTLFNCQEIQDMISLLTILHSPFNDVALATLLRSPLFGCSNEELLFFFQDKKTTSWFELLTADTSVVAEKFKLAKESLIRWREVATYLPIHDMLDKIYHETNIMQRYAETFPAHLVSRAQNNLSQFLALALQVDSGRYPSLGRFLAKLENLKQADASPDEASNSSDDRCVRIMTIHASKGLEAPVVFLADSCDAKANNSKHYQAIVQWPQNAKSPTAFRLCPAKEFHDQSLTDLLHSIEQKEQIEDANLLYVALTRARQALYISGTSKDGNAKGWYKTLQDFWPEKDQLSNPIIATETKPEIEFSDTLDFLPALYIAKENIIKELEVESEDSQNRGIIIHRALELLTQENQLAQSACLRQLFNEFSTVNQQETEKYYTEAINVINNKLFQSYFDQTFFICAYNEIPLQTINSNNTRLGIIDRLVITDQFCYIIDYKTHSDCNSEQLQNIAHTYQSQMNFYRQMVKNIWPQKIVKCLILFTHYNQAIELK